MTLFGVHFLRHRSLSPNRQQQHNDSSRINETPARPPQITTRSHRSPRPMSSSNEVASPRTSPLFQHPSPKLSPPNLRKRKAAEERENHHLRSPPKLRKAVTPRQQYHQPSRQASVRRDLRRRHPSRQARGNSLP